MVSMKNNKIDAHTVEQKAIDIISNESKLAAIPFLFNFAFLISIFFLSFLSFVSFSDKKHDISKIRGLKTTKRRKARAP